MASTSADTDTIVAIATPSGAGGVGVVRLSGPRSHGMAEALCGHSLRVRHAHHVRFRGEGGDTIDDGIALRFDAPASFTGEEVVELQAHGSPVLLRQLLARCCELGARMARAGEFSERAFRNGKLDLAQAEAVADLIAASDLRAARAARRSLDGEFSSRVSAIAATVLALRVQVEAAIDFADEPLDTLGARALGTRLDALSRDLAGLLAAAERGRRLRDGLHAVIVGPPNAGKSSLLNALAGNERAIVTDVAGTTRDLVVESIRSDGVALTLVDTAGLREGGDAIEREGMRRARAELSQADLAIVVLDARAPGSVRQPMQDAVAQVPRVLWLYNKVDLLAQGAELPDGGDTLSVSARTGAGIDALHGYLRALVLGSDASGADAFSARARHVDGLRRAASDVADARGAVQTGSLELAAESLHGAHDALGELVGRMLPDALLGHVFSTFCVGK